MRTLLSVIALVSLTSTALAEMYTWKDRHGTVFYTNSIHEIPARYLKKARVLDVATGKKGGLVTQQAAAPVATAPQQGQLPVPANAVTAPTALPSPPSPVAPLIAPAADPAAASAQQQPSPAPAAGAAPPVQTRVVLPRRPHRHPRGEE